MDPSLHESSGEGAHGKRHLNKWIHAYTIVYKETRGPTAEWHSARKGARF